MSAAIAEREAASLEELQAALEQRQTQRQALLAELAGEEDAARAEFLRLTPNGDPTPSAVKGRSL